MLAPLATSLNLALVGTPNSGKTALFNALTGSRQRAANYAGVTVERKSGDLRTGGRPRDHLSIYRALTRCGAEAPTKTSPAKSYSELTGEKTPDSSLCVADATNLRVACGW